MEAPDDDEPATFFDGVADGDEVEVVAARGPRRRRQASPATSGTWTLPSMDLLQRVKEQRQDRAAIDAAGDELVSALAAHGVETTLVGYTVGPTVTRFELELGPVHYYRQGSQNFLIAPALVLNFGIFENTELVIDANNYVALGGLLPGTSRDSFLGDDVLVKHTFREGALQGKTGVSIAAEGGVLTPEINGVTNVGASLDVITSYRWGCGTLHWNEWFEFTRDHHADLFTGVIAEGPHEWTVRPVAELFYDQDFTGPSTESLLLGAIWHVRDAFDLDVGVRGARVGEVGPTGAVAQVNALEVRLGLTWAITMWKPKAEAHE